MSSPCTPPAGVCYQVIDAQKGQLALKERVDGHGVRLGGVERSLVSVHGADGRNGKIGNLSASIKRIEKEREGGRARVWGATAILIGLFSSALVGVLSIRDRLTAIEVNGEINRAQIQKLIERVERLHDVDGTRPDR